MEAAEAIYTRVLSRFAADTGATGLNNSASPAYVREFHRQGDPLSRQVKGWPSIDVAVTSEDKSPPPGAAPTCEMFDSVVTFIVETDRDTGLGDMDRVEARIRALYNNNALATLIDTDDSRVWSFSAMWRLTPRDGDGGSRNNKTLRRAVSYRVNAMKGVV